MADTLKFRKGTESKLPAAVNGQVLFTTDTNKLYVDDGSSHKLVAGNAVVDITRSGTTFTMTKLDGTTDTFTQQDNNTTYSAGSGLNLSGTTFSHADTSSQASLTASNRTYIKSLTLDTYGHVTALTTGTETVTDTNTTYSAGTGLTLDSTTFKVTQANVNTMLNLLGEGTSDAQGADYLIAQYAGGGTSTTTYHRRSVSKIVNATTVKAALGTGTGTTKYLREDGTWVKPPNTTYSAGTGISLSGTKFSNSGVRAISTGSKNGTISVNTNGTTANVAVKGLGSNAYSSTAYLPLAGGTITGKIARSNQAGTTGQGWEGCLLSAENVSAYTGIYCGNGDAPANALGTSGVANLFIKSWYGVGFVDGCTGQGMTVGIDCRTGTIYSRRTYGAVWNDYAEFRSQIDTVAPGYCVASNDQGQVYKTTEKFQACDGIVSDTFGFAIGETDECKTPLAVAGRVLAYCEGDRYDYHAGDTVCAGPNGKVVKMSREEIREWPDRIIGIVSEIPEYEIWGTGNILVNGRIWIKVK